MKDVFEGTAATVAVRLTRGKSEAAKTAKLVFTATEGVSIAPGTLQLPAKPFVGQATAVKHKVTFPDVPAAKESYEVSYHVEFDGKKIPGPDSWRVWPDVVDLTTKRKIDGKLTENGNFVVQLVQGQSRKDYLVPMAGKAMLLIPEPAGFDLAVPSPRRFVGYLEGKDKGRVRVMEWDIVPHKARINEPVAGDDPIRTYVNMDFRNELKVEVETASHSGDVAPNQDVYVEVTFENPTKRGKKSPRPTDADYLKERTVAGLDTVAKSNNDLTWKGKIKTGGDAKATFSVYLGKGGGEKCTLKVGSTAGVEDDKRSFESWRKLFVQHTHSGTNRTKAAWPAAKRGPVTNAYKDVFIELEYAIDGLEQDKVYPDDLNLGERTGWVDGADIDRTKGTKYYIVNVSGTSMTEIAKRMAPRDPVQASLYVNVAACDLMYEVNFVSKKFTNVGRADAAIKGSELSSDKDESLGGLPKWANDPPRATYSLERMHGKDRVIEAGELPAENIEVSSRPKADRGLVKLKLPASAVAKIPSTGEWLVTYELHVLMNNTSATSGISDGGSSIILGEGAKGDAETCNTVIHELGHAIGMAGTVALLEGDGRHVNRLPDYTLHKKNKKDGTPVETRSYQEHSRWYSHRGHQGNHCATGLGSASYERWGGLSGPLNNPLTTFKCVIYGAGQIFKTPLSYCAECKDMLKAMEVWVGKMPKSQGGGG